MAIKKILYISGSIGLGHISKDLAIAQKLRIINPGVKITWLASHPANVVLKKKGEHLHPSSEQFSSYSALAERAAKGSHLNLVNYVLSSVNGWRQNVNIFKQIIKKEHFDLVVANETYEIIIGLIFRLLRFKVPFVIIYDFLGLDSLTGKPGEVIGSWILNWIWSRDHRILSVVERQAIFVGELEDIPNKKFGFLLPNRREYAEKYYKFIGYVVLFNPEEYADKIMVRKKLGYDERPLIICSIGGTSVGRGLLDICNQAYSIIKKTFPDLRMVFVTGPRLSSENMKIHPEVEVRGFVPDLYQHYAASDLAIVQGGFSSTLELTALKRPFIFFPIEGHSEQEYVAKRLTRYNAGIRMNYSETTPNSLAEKVISNLGKKMPYKAINTDGALRAAKAINELL